MRFHNFTQFKNSADRARDKTIGCDGFSNSVALLFMKFLWLTVKSIYTDCVSRSSFHNRIERFNQALSVLICKRQRVETITHPQAELVFCCDLKLFHFIQMWICHEIVVNRKNYQLVLWHVFTGGFVHIRDDFIRKFIYKTPNAARCCLTIRQTHKFILFLLFFYLEFCLL